MRAIPSIAAAATTALALLSATACTTAEPPERRPRAECERLAESRRDQDDRGRLDAHDGIELGFKGCPGY